MARLGLLSLAALLLMALAVPGLLLADQEVQRGSTVDNKLVVQMTWLKARDHLLQGDPAKAVTLLEETLERIEGDRKYLMLLRDAYRAHITNLFLAQQTDKAQKFLERLSIIDKQAAEELIGQPRKMVTTAALATQAPPAMAALAAQTPPLTAPPVPSRIAKTKARASGPGEPEDPFAPQHALDKGSATPAQQLLSQAEQMFQARHYTEARQLYERVHQADPQAVLPCKDRWAYCKLNHVSQQINKGDRACSYQELEREVRIAMALSPLPKLQSQANQLLQEIAQRREQQAVPGADIRVQHQPKANHGWAIAESANFRIYHNQPSELATQVAHIAEETRAAMIRKWFGESYTPWRQKCDIVLHATARDYSHTTSVRASSPGHSRIESDPNTGAVVSRRIELHCEAVGMLEGVLPHETTHVVLAGQLGGRLVPRWMDEGVAVLSEPSAKVLEHLRALPQAAQAGELFQVRDLLQMSEYPQAQKIGIFYAQSVSLVDFLSRSRSPQVFTQFVREGLTEGYDAALRKHYGFADMNELHQRWSQFALPADTSVVGRQ